MTRVAHGLREESRRAEESRGERQACPVRGEAPLQTLVGRQEGAGRFGVEGGGGQRGRLLQLEGQGACCQG